MITWASTVDFSVIRTPSGRHLTQTSISEDRIHLLTACIIYYDLHIPSVIRYLGGEYLGQHLDVPNILAGLRQYSCPDDILLDLERILTKGCPTKLVAEDTRANFIDYWKYGNHVSIATNIAKVLQTINKEDKNSFLMVLPAILGRLIPNIRYTPQGLVVKAGKNDRLIWDGSHLIFHYSVCVNMLMDQTLEPTLVYGTVLG